MIPESPRFLEGDIKIDEPLKLGQATQILSSENKHQQNLVKTFRPTSLGLHALNIQNSGRKIGSHRGPFRPKAFRGPPKKEEAKDESRDLSPRSKLMPQLAEKVNKEPNLEGRLTNP